MKIKSTSKIVAWVLTFALVLSLIPTMPLIVSADTDSIVWDSNAGNATTPVLVVEDGDVITIEPGASGRLTVPENATVTIVGGTVRMPVDNNDNIIQFYIPATSKVVWRAYYQSSSSSYSAVTVVDTGVFEVAEGLIQLTAGLSSTINANSGNVTVSGGSVIKTVRGYAINTTSGNVTISDGIVQGFDLAINTSANVIILGGWVSSATPGVISTGGENSVVFANTQLSGSTGTTAAVGATGANMRESSGSMVGRLSW